MKEYAEGEEEATHELQNVAIKEKKTETRIETEQKLEESRKWKRDAEE